MSVSNAHHSCPYSWPELSHTPALNLKRGWSRVQEEMGNGLVNEPIPTILALGHPSPNTFQLVHAPLKCDTQTLRKEERRKEKNG